LSRIVTFYFLNLNFIILYTIDFGSSRFVFQSATLILSWVALTAAAASLSALGQNI